MVTLYSSAAPVKPVNRVFGAGLLRSLPTVRVSHTAADEAWLVEDNARREGENRMFDMLAAESAAMDAMEAGFIPADVAAGLMATSIIGHAE